MFDPFFALYLLAGPAALLLLAGLEAQRKGSSLRPSREAVILGVISSFGLAQWILLYVVQHYGAGMTEDQFTLIALGAFAAGAAITSLICLVAVLVRRRRTNRLG